MPAGVIEPGPEARRTRTSFFQDGDYQTEVFRRLEEQDPAIEHLGYWHTHHVNGYPRLSGGDVATYRRIVNHELQNLDFFYALLVTHHREECRIKQLGQYRRPSGGCETFPLPYRLPGRRPLNVAPLLLATQAYAVSSLELA